MKNIQKFIAIFLILCSLIFYTPKLNSSSAEKVTHNGNEYYSVSTETEIFNDISYMYYSSYDDDSQNYKYDKNSSFYKYRDKEEEVLYSYFLDILEIAETENHELIVYVFEPYYVDINDEVIHFSNEPHAKSVNISVGYGENLSFTNYELELLKSSLEMSPDLRFLYRIFKYKVKNFVVSSELTRYYEFSSIYSDIKPDGQSVGQQGDGQTINEYAYSVGLKYRFVTDENGVTSIDKQSSIVVTITDKFVGYVRYKNTTKPSWIDKDSCDRHFIAFSTDLQIDKLKEAEVYYTSQTLLLSGTVGSPTKNESYGEKQENYVNLTYTQKAEIENSGNLFWKGCSYSWSRIQNLSDFKSSVDMQNVYTKGIFDSKVESQIDEENKQQLENKQWFLSFVETDYEYSIIPGERVTAEKENRTIVGEVSILRLRFETAGVEYNLGVVDNKTTGSKDPVNSITTSYGINLEAVKDMFGQFKYLIGIILLILLIVLLWPIILPIISLVINIVMFVLKLIIKILTLPFKLFNKKSKRGKQR